MFIEYNQRSYISDGCFLSITPEDNAIEMDRIALMSLKDISLLDGELICSEKRNIRECQLLNRIIGLFRVDKFSKKLDQREYIPDYIYFNGKQKKADTLDTCISKYLNVIKNIRKEQNVQLLKGPPYPKNLCPITKKIIKRYLQLLIEDKKDSEHNIQYTQERVRVAKEDFKIFISYKSEDRQMANALYQFLNCEKEGLRNKIFFSSESIMQVGESDYAQIIDQALEKASCLIVVGSKPEFFNSGWVGYEWRSFLNEIRSNRKKNGQVFTFTNGVPLDQLPYGLRSVKNIPYNPTSQQDSFDKLYVYLKNVI